MNNVYHDNNKIDLIILNRIYMKYEYLIRLSSLAMMHAISA